MEEEVKGRTLGNTINNYDLSFLLPICHATMSCHQRNHDQVALVFGG